MTSGFVKLFIIVAAQMFLICHMIKQINALDIF